MTTNTQSGQHRFAFFITHLDAHVTRAEISSTFRSDDPVLFHRLKSVLRLEPSEHCTLFNDEWSVEATIVSFDKKGVTFFWQNKKVHAEIVPPLTWLLPLLKKDAFEESLYSLTEMGASIIQPIRTTKSQQNWGSGKEYARAHLILQAAAEQSKQFRIPKLLPVGELRQVPMSDHSAFKIFFDAEGSPFSELLSTMAKAPPPSLIVCTGPEGDLTGQEKNYLGELGFKKYALTPTILRAQQAVAVGLGILRTCLND